MAICQCIAIESFMCRSNQEVLRVIKTLLQHSILMPCIKIVGIMHMVWVIIFFT